MTQKMNDGNILRLFLYRKQYTRFGLSWQP